MNGSDARPARNDWLDDALRRAAPEIGGDDHAFVDKVLRRLAPRSAAARSVAADLERLRAHTQEQRRRAVWLGLGLVAATLAAILGVVGSPAHGLDAFGAWLSTSANAALELAVLSVLASSAVGFAAWHDARGGRLPGLP